MIIDIECYKLTLYCKGEDHPRVAYQRSPHLEMQDGFIVCHPEKDSPSLAGISSSLVNSWQIDPITKEK